MSHFRQHRGWVNWQLHFAGKEAGCLASGRCVVVLNGVSIPRAAIIWFLKTGEWVRGIRHIDGDNTNDRRDNLRIGSKGLKLVRRFTPPAYGACK